MVTSEVVSAHERMLGHSRARGRHVALRSGRRVHLVEVGEGPPVVLLHGSNTSSLSLMPLLEQIHDVHAIAADRPGFGLSEPVPAPAPRERFRDGAVAFVDQLRGALGLDAVALAGASAGGTWALWYALARPERVRRLVLLGAAPLLPGTRVPPPLRLAAAPMLGDVLARVPKPSPKLVARLLASMGEGDTIVRYPALIDAVAAAGRDPLASATNLAELRAMISAFGFRHSVRIRPDELRRLRVPTQLLWGNHDPVGSVATARAVAGLIPDARLELLPGGHVPYFGDPERAATLVSRFVRS